MWYREVLAVRHALAVFAVVLAIAGSFNAWGAGDSGGVYVSQAVAVATVSACIFALVIGTRLGPERKNTPHSAFVRPISRAGYAWTVFTVDVAAVVLAYVVALVAFVAPYQLAHGFPKPDLGGVSLLTALLLPVAAGLSWYGVTVAAGVATRGARAAAVLLGPIAVALWSGAVVYGWHAAGVFRALSLVNPLMYLVVAFEHVERAAHPQSVGALSNGFYDALSVGADAAILLAIGILGLLAATLAWQRAEV